MNRAKVRRIKPEEVALLTELAAKDDHIVLGATHVILKGDEITGYLSIGGITTVNVWLDSEKMKAPDTINALGQLDAILENAGVENYFMPCSEDSPFFQVMDKIGFRKIFKTVMHLKSLRRK